MHCAIVHKWQPGPKVPAAPSSSDSITPHLSTLRIFSSHIVCLKRWLRLTVTPLMVPWCKRPRVWFCPSKAACRIWGSVMRRYQQWQYDTIETIMWFLSTKPCEQHSEHSIRCGRVQRHFHLQTKALWGGQRLFPNIVFCLPQSQDTKTLKTEDALYYDRVWSAMLMPCR